MNTRSKFFRVVVFVLFFAAMLGKETKVVAQDYPSYSEIDFPRRIITVPTDSSIKNAPFVFEGRMIKSVDRFHYRSYLFEIEKVYRGGERLQAGTVEFIENLPEFRTPEYNLVHFLSGWHLIFAKEAEDTGTFDANNSIKFEIFYRSEYKSTSYFDKVYSHGSYYLGFGGGLCFKTQEDIRSFLANDYGLFPKDMPKADTLKIAIKPTKEEIEEAKAKAEKRAIEEAAETKKKLEQEENRKGFYRYSIEAKWLSDSIAGKKTSRKAIDDAMKEYENAPDSVRNRMYNEKLMEHFQKIDSLNKAKKSQGQLYRGGGDTATLTVSIQNVKNTGNSMERFLKFDVMMRANRPRFLS